LNFKFEDGAAFIKKLFFQVAISGGQAMATDFIFPLGLTVVFFPKYYEWL